MPDFAHLGDREVHQGHVWSVVVGAFRSPDGIEFQRDLVRSPGAVGVVALLFDPEGQPSVVLVEQYRPALDTTMIEIPAGMRDVDGEPPEHTAARELAEEAGLRATTLSRLGELHPSPGMTDSSTIIYLATQCEPTEQNLQGPEEDHLEVVHLPLSEAVAMVSDGRITDAKTVIGLLMAERTLGSE
jgi:nudix-type nucleoside diphosphatase (YffH/AdpP family)